MCCPSRTCGNRISLGPVPLLRSSRPPILTASLLHPCTSSPAIPKPSILLPHLHVSAMDLHRVAIGPRHTTTDPFLVPNCHRGGRFEAWWGWDERDQKRRGSNRRDGHLRQSQARATEGARSGTRGGQREKGKEEWMRRTRSENERKKVHVRRKYGRRKPGKGLARGTPWSCQNGTKAEFAMNGGPDVT